MTQAILSLDNVNHTLVWSPRGLFPKAGMVMIAWWRKSNRHPLIWSGFTYNGGPVVEVLVLDDFNGRVGATGVVGATVVIGATGVGGTGAARVGRAVVKLG